VNTWSSLVVIDAEFIRALTRAPTRPEQNLVAFLVVGLVNGRLHLVGRDFVRFRSFDIKNRSLPKYKLFKRNFVEQPRKLRIGLQRRRIEGVALMGDHDRAAG